MDKKIINKYLRVFLFLAGVILLLRIPALYQHIVDMDESVFSEFGRVILDGGLPYVDVIDNKPPFMYYFFALVYFVSGNGSLITVHVVTSVWVALTGLFIYIFSQRLKGEAAGITAAAAFIFLMHTYEPKYISTNGETLINLFLVASAYIFTAVRGRWTRTLPWHILSGIILGSAVMTNYKAGILALVYILHAMIAEPLICGNNRKELFKTNFFKLLVTGLSSLVPILIVAVKYYKDGNFSEALFWGFTYNFGYIESGSSIISAKMALRTGLFTLCTLPLWIIVFKNCSEHIASVRRKVFPVDGLSVFVFFVLWLAASIYAALLGGRGYGHYFIQIVPPLILTAIMCPGEFRLWRKSLWIWICVPVLIMTAGRVDIQKSYTMVGEKNASWSAVYSEAAQYISTHTVQGETVYVWGWATPVYYYSDRRSASRFIISDFVSGRVFGTANNSKEVRGVMTERFMPLLIEDLDRNRPAYILDTSKSGLYGYDRFPPERFPDFDRYIWQNYVRETEIGGIVIYARR